MRKPASVSYGPSGSRKPVCSASSSSRSMPSTSQVRSPPGAVSSIEPGVRLGSRRVVLVGDLADQLLDQILDGDHAVGAAVLVDHDGQVGAGRPQRGQHAVEVEALRHEHRLAGDRGHRRGRPGGPAARRARRSPPTTPVTWSSVSSYTGKRLCPVSRAAASSSATVAVGLAAPTTSTRGRHRLGRPLLAEADRALQQHRGLGGQRAGPRRDRGEQAQLLRRAGAGQLLLRLDAEPADQPVGRAVERADQPARTAAEKARMRRRRWPARPASAGPARRSSAPARRRASTAAWPATSASTCVTASVASPASGSQRPARTAGPAPARPGSR